MLRPILRDFTSRLSCIEVAKALAVLTSSDNLKGFIHFSNLLWLIFRDFPSSFSNIEFAQALAVLNSAHLRGLNFMLKLHQICSGLALGTSNQASAIQFLLTLAALTLLRPMLKLHKICSYYLKMDFTSSLKHKLFTHTAIQLC